MRMLTSSNLPLSLADYRQIYHNLNNDLKQKLMNEAKVKKINIFYLLLKDIAIVQTMKEFNSLIKRKQYNRLLNKKFIILKTVIRRNLGSGVFSYKVKDFLFFINRKLIYKKKQLIKI